MGTPINLWGPQRPPQPGLMDVLMQRFMTGMSIGQTIREANQQAEQQKLQMEVLKHQLDSMKLEGKIAPLRQQLEIAKLLQGMPGRQLPMSVNPQSVDVPGLADLGGATQPSGATTTFGLSPSTGSVETPNAPINIDLSAVFPGRGQMEVPIQNQTQMLNQALREAFARWTIEAQGEGMKAGAKARAELPYQTALEGAKAETAEQASIRAAERDMTKTRFVQGQENQRAGAAAGSRITAAQIGADATRTAAAVSQENKLQDDFRAEMADFTIIDDNYAKVKAAATNRAGGPASDIALVYGFMKLNDPRSTVREGERADAANAAGVPAWVRNQYNALIEGKASLPAAARQNILRASEEAYKAVQPRLKMVENRFQTRARKAGADPSLFTFQSGANAGPARVQSDADYAALPSGATFIAPDGTTRRKP